MKSVWRTTLPITDEWTGTLDYFLRMLHVAPSRDRALQNTAVEVWYEVDPDAPEREVAVWFEGTGHTIDHDGEYLDSVFVVDGALVWHVYWKATS